jgi:hypothetical protein
MDVRDSYEQIGHLVLGDVLPDRYPIDFNAECHDHKSLEGHPLDIDMLATTNSILGLE